MILTKMTLENISDVPQICSGTLRIAPRALNFLNFLSKPPPPPPPRSGGHWAPPLRTFPLRRLRRLEWRFAPHIVINKISWHPSPNPVSAPAGPPPPSSPQYISAGHKLKIFFCALQFNTCQRKFCKPKHRFSGLFFMDIFQIAKMSKTYKCS